MSRLDAIVDALRDPAAYPHPVDGEVSVIQTHISVVFLTGAYAYKIKKPVDLGFLDYSTLEKRKEFCEREVEINARSAPDIYIATVPIFKTRDGFSFIADSDKREAAEYAVKMHQFREEDILLRRFVAGTFTARDALELGDTIADAHRAAPLTSAESDFGSAISLRAVAIANADKVRPHIGQTISAKAFDAIKAGTLALISENAERIDARKRDGYIRECHGDLHLNNICIIRDCFQLFDRIEFNDAFTQIDVMYDLAFLLMDLRYRGAAALANTVMNAYTEQTGDYAGVTLLPLYRSMRAFIRGEVQSILASEPEVSADARRSARDEAERYFELAHAELQPRSGAIVLMCGVSGSGKSHLAANLAQSLDALRIRSDALRKHIAHVPLCAHHRDIYSDEVTEAVYHELRQLGAALATHGTSVILDATFLTRAQRAAVISAARNATLQATVVHCIAPPEILAARIANRTDDPSDATAKLLPEQQDRLELPTEDEGAQVITIDTNKSIDIETIAAQIRHPDR